MRCLTHHNVVYVSQAACSADLLRVELSSYRQSTGTSTFVPWRPHRQLGLIALLEGMKTTAHLDVTQASVQSLMLLGMLVIATCCYIA